METTYKLNAQDITAEFLASVQASVKGLFPGRDIEITVREAEGPLDEAERLFWLPANQAWLGRAIENVERGENITTFETLADAMRHAEEQAAQ